MSAEQYMRDYLKNEKNTGAAADKVRKVVQLFDKKKAGAQPDYEEVIKICCWGSLAYCCKTKGKGGKTCPWRDAALELLDISQDDFERLKEKQTGEFRELQKKGAPEKAKHAAKNADAKPENIKLNQVCKLGPGGGCR